MCPCVYSQHLTQQENFYIVNLFLSLYYYSLSTHVIFPFCIIFFPVFSFQKPYHTLHLKTLSQQFFIHLTSLPPFKNTHALLYYTSCDISRSLLYTPIRFLCQRCFTKPVLGYLYKQLPFFSRHQQPFFLHAFISILNPYSKCLLAVTGETIGCQHA